MYNSGEQLDNQFFSFVDIMFGYESLISKKKFLDRADDKDLLWAFDG